MTASRAARPVDPSHRTTWRHVWLAGLGAAGASLRNARTAIRDSRVYTQATLEKAKDVAGTAVERFDAAQRRVERRLQALRPRARE